MASLRDLLVKRVSLRALVKEDASPGSGNSQGGGWQQSSSPTSGITAYGNTGKTKRSTGKVKLRPRAASR